MAQTYTLDEAAAKVGLSVSEFKRKLREEWKDLRTIRDGSNLRFRTQDIDELASSLGKSSSEDLEITEDFKLADDAATRPMSALNKKTSSDDDIALNLDTSSEADLYLEDLKPKSGDSDIRLERHKKDSKSQIEATEEISLELPAPAKGASGKLGSTTSKTPKPTPADRQESEFELTLDTGSDEFELALNTDSDDEVKLADLPSTPSAGKSGINIGKPADSGVSLEKAKKKPAPSDDDINLELASDKSPGKSSRNLKDDSDSEFELNLDDSIDSGSGERGDIFETDMDLQALDDDSASEVQALEGDTDLENSDFDLAVEGSDVESASEVVELDDDEAPVARGLKGGKGKGKVKAEDDGGISFDDMDLDDSISASKALRGASLEDGGVEFDEDNVVYKQPEPAKWPAYAVVLMIPCMFLMFVGGLMGYELLHSMWGYQQPSRPAGVLVEGVAKIFGFEIK